MIKKTSALILVISIATATGVFLSSWRTAPTKPEFSGSRRPNVVLIFIDDLNDWVGYLQGHPATRTPNLDALANQSFVFTNAHSPAPSCGPARAAILTGIRPSSSGIYNNLQPLRTALPTATTLPQHLRNNGYYSLGAGKVFHQADPASWDEYYPSLTRDMPDEPFKHFKNLNGLDRAQFDWGPLDDPPESMSDHQVAQWATEKLNSKIPEPFFMSVGIYRPHLPWYLPREAYRSMGIDDSDLPMVPPDDLDDIPAAGLAFIHQEEHQAVVDAGQWKAAVNAYLASIHFADTLLGKILHSLDSSGYADNTIIIVTSDHGWHLGEKRHWRKFTLWERATHVPLLIRLPEDHAIKRSPNAEFSLDGPVSLLDIYPTVTDLLQISLPAQVEGQSLTPLLKGVNTGNRFALTTKGFNNHSVRSDRWRYTRYADGSEELYDHDSDPDEFYNLAHDTRYASIIRDLNAQLPSSNAPPAPYYRDAFWRKVLYEWKQRLRPWLGSSQ